MTQQPFIPRPGQVDFTNIRWCPVINCVVQYENKILVVKRSKEMRLYPEYWNGISGFLDDDKNLEEKIYEELREELGLSKDAIISWRLGTIFHGNDDEYKKTWIVHPVLVHISTDRIKLDWEAEEYAWVMPEEVLHGYKLLPSFDRVLKILFHL